MNNGLRNTPKGEGDMLKRFGQNLFTLLFWTSVILFSLSALILLVVFGYSLVEHFTTTQDPGWGESLDEQRPSILWWALAAGLGSAVATVAIYSTSPDPGEYFYCPNCNCESCVEERRQRALDDVTTAAMAGGIAGGIVGGNIGNSS